MTAEIQNNDGQYVPLGFTPSPATEHLNWSQHQSFMNFHSEPLMNREQYQQQSYNYMPAASHMYEPNGYKKSFSDYDMYKSMQNGGSEMGLYDRNYRLVMPHHQMVNNIPDHASQDSTPHMPNRTQLIEHLVGNWMVPNNSGTYSPFGNAEAFKTNVFELPAEGVNAHQGREETKFKNPDEEIQFQFTRDSRKPRMVAEVKPMRPSYSDVLTKPVPQVNTVKSPKNDPKEVKPKKENKKTAKNDKEKKTSATLNRSNTANDIKEIPNEKNAQTNFKNDKIKSAKNSQMNRKWASLDNISENLQKGDDSKKKKSDEPSNNNKTSGKQSASKKINKTIDIGELDNGNGKNETISINKNGIKKVNKINNRPKSNDSFGNSERPPGKRNQRTRKKENAPFGMVFLDFVNIISFYCVVLGVFHQKLKQYTKGWWKIFTVFIFWLFHLISDICSLSLHISRDL